MKFWWQTLMSRSYAILITNRKRDIHAQTNCRHRPSRSLVYRFFSLSLLAHCTSLRCSIHRVYTQCKQVRPWHLNLTQRLITYASERTSGRSDGSLAIRVSLDFIVHRRSMMPLLGFHLHNYRRLFIWSMRYVKRNSPDWDCYFFSYLSLFSSWTLSVTV